MPNRVTDEEAHSELACVVGAMTLTWALAENALNMAIAMIDREFGSPKGHPGLPRTALTKKLDYLKVALRDVTELGPVSHAGRGLIEAFRRLKGRRDELTHGLARQVFEGQFVSVRFHVDGREQTSTLTLITAREVDALLGEVMSLSNDALIFAAKVGGIVG